MQLNSTLSATARPFQPQATASSALVDDIPQDYPAWNGLARGSPTMGIITSPPVGRALLNHRYTSDEEGVSTDTATSGKSLRKRHGGRGNRGNRSGSYSDETPAPRGRWKKKDGFSSKIQILEFGGKKGHPHDVADTFRQWACCITYCREYYEDSYLMPLVVSSLMLQTCSIGCIVSLLEVPRIYPCSYRCSGNITVVPSHFGSRGTWSRTYARELMKMPLIL